MASLSVLVLMVGGLVIGVGVGPASASFVTYSIRTNPVAVTGKPYTFTFNAAEASGIGASATFEFTRTAATGNKPTQTHSWYFGTVPTDDITVAGDLKTATIDTADDLDKFGSVALHLQHPSALTTTHLKCSDGSTFATATTRTGTLAGTVDFDANDDYFHSVHKTSLPASLGKTVYNGHACPAPPATCAQGLSFNGGDPDAPITTSASRALSGGKVTLSISSSTTDFPADVTHAISVMVPLTAFKVSSTFLVTLNGGSAAPFATGIVKFAKTGSPTVTTDHGCKTTRQPEQYKSGSVLAKFDSGPNVTLHAGTGQATKVAKVSTATAAELKRHGAHPAVSVDPRE